MPHLYCMGNAISAKPQQYYAADYFSKTQSQNSFLSLFYTIDNHIIHKLEGLHTGAQPEMSNESV